MTRPCLREYWCSTCCGSGSGQDRSQLRLLLWLSFQKKDHQYSVISQKLTWQHFHVCFSETFPRPFIEGVFFFQIGNPTFFFTLFHDFLSFFSSHCETLDYVPCVLNASQVSARPCISHPRPVELQQAAAARGPHSLVPHPHPAFSGLHVLAGTPNGCHTVSLTGIMHIL